MNPLILRGDARKIPLPDESVSAIVTDPPYELTGKSGKVGFMQKRWDGTGVSFDPATWAESLRVLKPGGHLLAFGGDRTHHRVMVAIEDAGFEIRRCVCWHFGTGFPKSLDISKAIDKMAGAERKVVGKRPIAYPDSPSGYTSVSANSTASKGGIWQAPDGDTEHGRDVTEPATDAARKWQGWGTDLKPSFEIVIIARKPFAGNVVSNVLAHGTGGINVDAGRIAGVVPQVVQGVTERAAQGEAIYGAGSDLRRNPQLSNPSDLGRWPPNTAFQHNCDCRLVGVRRVRGSGKDGPEYGVSKTRSNCYAQDDYTLNKMVRTGVSHVDPDGLETVEVWECSDGCPVAEIDRQGSASGVHSAGHARDYVVKDRRRDRDEGWGDIGNDRAGSRYGDDGGCSRFFPRFAWDDDDWFPYLYCSKASRAERNQGLQESTNSHPTCKPVRFMEWLIRLVMPPGGILLDPFAGSGSTLVAAVRCGVTAIGLDNDREHGYHAIQAARVRHALENARPEAAFPTDASRDVLPIPPIKSRGRKRKRDDGPTLFD
jgi:hypothetical protein